MPAPTMVYGSVGHADLALFCRFVSVQTAATALQESHFLVAVAAIM